MKKILLATTMLAGFAGFASAEGVTTTGEARMGIIYDGEDAYFTSRVRVKFAMEGETDGGLAFGAEVRNDQSGQGNEENGDSVVYISGAFGKLSMGDVGSAADNIVGNVSGVGLTGLDDWNELGFIGNAKTAAKYEYTSGAFTAAISVGQTNGVTLDTTEAFELPHDTASVAVKYAGESFAVSLGYEDVSGTVTQLETETTPEETFNGSGSQVSLGVDATFDAITAKVRVADQDLEIDGVDVSNDDLAYAISVDYAAGATTFTAFYSANKIGKGDVSAFGIGAAYDLGGGASVKGGIVDVEDADTMFDIGVSMSF